MFVMATNRFSLSLFVCSTFLVFIINEKFFGFDYLYNDDSAISFVSFVVSEQFFYCRCILYLFVLHCQRGTDSTDFMG